jgi:carbon-monoxide dehydrogenase medium subunit
VKPPPFTYHAPADVDGALATLADLGDEGKVLAGGQSLIPLLNMRLAAPAHLVDISRIGGLDHIDVDHAAVTVGAAVRHATLERHAGATAAVPLLAQALRHVAHPVIRNRGTVCGSIAHADPAGELTAVLALLGGTVRVARHGGAARDIAAADFFVAPLESALRPGDLVTSVRFPRPAPGSGSAFVELARRHGDYALCGIGATVTRGDDGTLASAAVGAISIHPTPLVVDCSAAVAGRPPDDGDALAAAGEVVDAASEPSADLHATIGYRRQLIRVLTGRAIAAAAVHATDRSRTGGTHG